MPVDLTPLAAALAKASWLSCLFGHGPWSFSGTAYICLSCGKRVAS